jgi:hypothetical protein
MSYRDQLPTMTAACEVFGRHASCRGTVLSLTEAHLSPCSCPCHEQGRATVATLPDAWKEAAVALPPCDQDGAA